MLKITPCQDDRNCNSLWTVEHIGTNEKVVYIDGKELKKGQDGIMRIGLGSEIVFWNWKARNQVHGQDQDQDQEESYKIVFRVNDIENIEECKTMLESKNVELNRLGDDSTSCGHGGMDCGVDVKHKSDMIATERDESTLDCDDARRGQDVDNDNDLGYTRGGDDGLIVNGIENGNRSDERSSDHVLLRDDSQCEPLSKGGEYILLRDDSQCEPASKGGETITGNQAKVELIRKEVELNCDSTLPVMTVPMSEGILREQFHPRISNAEEAPFSTSNLARNEVSGQILNAEKESGEVVVTPMEPIIPMESSCASEFTPHNEHGHVVDLVSPGGKGEPQCVNIEAASLDKEDDSTGTPRKDGNCTPERQIVHSSSQNVIDLISPDGKLSSLLSVSSFVPVIDLFSDESESQHRNPDSNITESSMNNAEANAQSIKEKEAPKIQHAVYFLQRGIGMAQKRIDILTASLQSKHPHFPIHTKFNKMNPPQYIVLDGSLTVDHLCLDLGFKDICEMATYLKGVHLVTTNWVIKYSKSGPEAEELKPTMNQCWSGTFELEKKRKAVDNPEVEDTSPLDNTWMKRRRKTHEFAPVVRIPASKVNNEMISRLYNGIHDTNGNGNGNGKVSAQNQSRNIDLSRMLDTISKLYKECPLETRDNWRSYTYQIASVRLRYLDFDVNTQTLQKLKSIKGFGEKMLGHIKECLSSKDDKCELIRSFEHDEQRLAIRNMNDIWGVGPAKVSRVK